MKNDPVMGTSPPKTAAPRPCPVCGDPRSCFTLNAYAERITREESASPPQWNYYRCSTCELTYLSPLPSQEVLKTYYQSETYHCASAIGPSGFLKRALFALPFRIQSALARPLPLGRGRKLLDFGCGTGEYMAYAQRRGWEPTGVEFDESSAATARAKGFRVITDTDLPNQPDAIFDCITLIHSFEHVPDPFATLSSLLAKLKPGGKLIIEVPYLECLEYRLFGRHYCMIQAPVHLQFFTDRTMDRLAERLGLPASVKKNNVWIPTYGSGSLLNAIDQRAGIALSRRTKMLLSLLMWPLIGWIPMLESFCGQPVGHRQYLFSKPDMLASKK